MKIKTITFHIKLDSLGIRLLLLAVLVTSLTSSVAIAQDANSEPAIVIATTTYLRKYYLTINLYQGDDVLTACAAGYHTATLWDILDTSNLVYDTTLGKMNDYGDGVPPTGLWGWVRTGAEAGIGPGTGSNCADWSSNFNGYTGTTISLPNDWSIPGSKMGVWKTNFYTCNIFNYVWCVGD